MFAIIPLPLSESSENSFDCRVCMYKVMSLFKKKLQVLCRKTKEKYLGQEFEQGEHFTFLEL